MLKMSDILHTAQEKQVVGKHLAFLSLLRYLTSSCQVQLILSILIFNMLYLGALMKNKYSFKSI